MEQKEIKNPILRFLWAVDHGLQELIKWLCVGLVAAVVAIVVMQVFARYLFSFSFRWVEELARLLTVYAALLGGALAARRGELARVTVLTERLPTKAVTVLEYVCYGLTCLFCLLAITGSIRVMGMVIEYGQLTATMRAPKWISYFSVMLSMSFLLFFTINKVIFRICGLYREDPSNVAEEGLV